MHERHYLLKSLCVSATDLMLASVAKRQTIQKLADSLTSAVVRQRLAQKDMRAHQLVAHHEEVKDMRWLIRVSDGHIWMHADRDHDAGELSIATNDAVDGCMMLSMMAVLFETFLSAICEETCGFALCRARSSTQNRYYIVPFVSHRT